MIRNAVRCSENIRNSVTQGEETHVGLGALHGTLIVGATLAGMTSRPATMAKLLSLTREEKATAKAALDH
jgi:hypothetical protein